MKKNIYHLLFLFLLMSISAFSAKQKDSTDLINLFDKLQKIPGAKLVDVDYTGSFSKQVSSFEWLRDKGYGLTHGKRIAIGNYDSASVMKIHHVFESYSKQQHVILEHQDAATTFQNKIFFGYRYENDSLYFLCAMADSELCIPRQWPTLNHYTGPLQNENKKNLWTKFDKKTRYALGLARLWSGIKQNFVFMLNSMQMHNLVQNRCFLTVSSTNDLHFYQIRAKMAKKCRPTRNCLICTFTVD